ncbi:hypothetical protein CL620_02000 [archaeon]|nr:hypothetical protein [archaeon]
MSQQYPIFGLIRRIENDDLAKELIRFAQFQDLRHVEDVAKYSRPALEELGVSGDTIGELETRLKTDYQLEFATVSPTRRDTAAFEVVNKGHYLEVNGVEIRRGHGRSLSLDRAEAVYRAFQEDPDFQSVVSKAGVSRSTVVTYLRRANLLPPIKKRSARPKASVVPGKRHYTSASGAPPESVFALIQRRPDTIE